MTPASRRSSSSGPSTALGLAVLGLLAWGTFAFGGVYPWAYWPLAAGCTLVGCRAILQTDAWRDPRTKGLGLALALVAGAIALQLIPWWWGLTHAVSPGIQSYFEQYQFGYQSPRFQTLSIAPVHTWAALGLFVALSVWLLGLSRAIRSISLDWLMSGLMSLGVVLALVGIIQRSLMDEEHPLVYGFWKPLEGGHVFGPFINRNHFAGWMVMVLPIVVGYSCGVVNALRPPSQKTLKDWVHWATAVDANRFILAAGAILVMGASLVLTQSRSGMLGMAVGIAVIAGVVLARANSTKVRAAALLYFAALLVGAVFWTGAGHTVGRFAEAPAAVEGRLSAWRDALKIIEDFPVTGTGLGTFGRAMLVYQSSKRDMMYAQAHNDYLQLAAEGGLLVVIPVLLALGLLVLGIRRRRLADDDDVVTSWVRTGAIAGLMGIAVQSVMEFSLQMPGNAAMFAFVAALAMHRPRRSRAHRI